MKALCKDGALARAQSCIFHPKGPSEISREGEPAGEAPPVIYVEAPHVYYSKKVPKQPPCPKHGWESTGEVGVLLARGAEKRQVGSLAHFAFFTSCIFVFLLGGGGIS